MTTFPFSDIIRALASLIDRGQRLYVRGGGRKNTYLRFDGGALLLFRQIVVVGGSIP